MNMKVNRCRARSVTERDEIGKVDQRMKVDDSGELPCGLHDLHSRLSRLGSQFPVTASSSNLT